MPIKSGDCVKIPDGRLGRARTYENHKWKVRVRRKQNSHKKSPSYQFLYFPSSKLKIINCPSGWMSRKGYNNYVKITLSKMKKRLSKKRSNKRR